MLYQILFTGSSSLDDMIRRKLLRRGILFVGKLILEGYGQLLRRGILFVWKLPLGNMLRREAPA